jgi:alpha-mannosidase
VTAHGQTIDLPAGRFNRIYVLAAANGDQDAAFHVDQKPVQLHIQDWTGNIGQWYVRDFEERVVPVPHRPGSPAERPGARPRMRRVFEFTGQITPGFIKRDDVAWFSSHRHASDGTNEPYAYSYLFAYPIDAPSGAKRLTLPDNDRVRILAVSVADESSHVDPAQPLYDTLQR